MCGGGCPRSRPITYLRIDQHISGKGQIVPIAAKRALASTQMYCCSQDMPVEHCGPELSLGVNQECRLGRKDAIQEKHGKPPAFPTLQRLVAVSFTGKEDTDDVL